MTHLTEAAQRIREDRANVTRNREFMDQMARDEYDLATAHAAELDETPLCATVIETLSPIKCGKDSDGCWWFDFGDAIIEQGGDDPNVFHLGGDCWLHMDLTTLGQLLTALRLMGMR